MKTKPSASRKKQSVTVKDLKTRKNPKGGVVTVDVVSPTGGETTLRSGRIDRRG